MVHVQVVPQLHPSLGCNMSIHTKYATREAGAVASVAEWQMSLNYANLDTRRVFVPACNIGVEMLGAIDPDSHLSFVGCWQRSVTVELYLPFSTCYTICQWQPSVGM